MLKDEAMTATEAVVPTLSRCTDDPLDQRLPEVPPAGMRSVLNRARLRELINLAYETVDWLESKGLKRGEQCAFREVAEKIWFTQK